MNPAGSFLVEKCFTASNFSRKEAIVAELLAARSELSKTRHGFHLLKKLDVDRYARRPEQWRASQTSKETTLRQFEVEFGSNSKSVAQNFEEKFISQSPSKKSKHGKSDKITEDASCNKLAREDTSMAFLKDSGKRKPGGFLSDKPILKKQKHHRPTSGKPDGKRFGQSSSSSMPFVKNTGKPKQSIADLADLAGKEKLTAAEVSKLLKPQMSKS